MPTYLLTNNSTAQNGVTADTIINNGMTVGGCNEQSPNFPGYRSEIGFGNFSGIARHLVVYPFLLMNLPRGGTVTSARFHIKTSGVVGGTTDVNANTLNARPQPTRSTWNDRGFDEPWSVAGLTGSEIDTPEVDSVAVSGTNTWVTFDFTDYAQSVISGGPNNGFALISQNIGLNNAFALLLDEHNGSDGDYPQFEVVMTGGSEGGLLPTSGDSYDFTGNNGGAPPSGLDVQWGTFEINGNQLAATGTNPNALPPPDDAYGWLIGNDTGTADGEVSLDYNLNGGTGDLAGIKFRYKTKDNFLDVIPDATGSDLILFHIEDRTTSRPIATHSTAGLPSTFNVRVRFLGDWIRVYLNDVLVISAFESANNDSTVHGIKASGVIARYDNLTLPAIASAARSLFGRLRNGLGLGI